jgi:putative transposase
MRVRLSRPIEGKIKTCCIKKEADGWYVSFSVEEDRSPYHPKTGKSTGLDLGIENLAARSDGEQIENPRHLKKAANKLRKTQRKVSKRKSKRSQRRRKAVVLLAKQHLKIKRQRLDFFHKQALKLIKEFDHFAIEDLNIKGLVRNHHLAKAISDAAWNTFVEILIHKAESAGRVIQKVDARFTSQDCSNCGNRVRKSLSEREHRCIVCGFVAHRDHNAAINILGRSVPSGWEHSSLQSHRESHAL